MPYDKKRKPETREIDRNLSKSIKHPVLMVYRHLKTAKKQSIYYLRTILALITRKAIFKQMLIDNFQQQIESCALNAQNA